MKNKIGKVLVRKIGCAVGILLAGCAVRHHDAILFATNTQLGVKVGVNSQQIPEIQVGYNRQEGALVPLYKADLDGQPGNLSSNAPVVSGYLSEVTRHLPDQFADASAWTAFKRGNLVVVQNLMTGIMAKEKNPLTGDVNVEIGKMKAIADNDLSGAAIALATTRAKIRIAESQPERVIAFNEKLKYVGSNENGRKQDAYSVLGTFSGGGSATSSTTGTNKAEADGKLAQFFATGVAAQLLAESGGAALFSTKAKTPGETTNTFQHTGSFQRDEASGKLRQYLIDADGTYIVANTNKLTGWMGTNGLSGVDISFLLNTKELGPQRVKAVEDLKIK